MRCYCLRWWAAVAALVVVFSVPTLAFAEEPTGTPPQHRPDERPPPSARWTVLGAGAGVLVGSYGLGFGSSFMWSDAPNAEQLRIPVVGPWLALGDVRCGSDETDCDNVTLVIRSIFATLSGIGQAGGLLLIGEALFLPTASGAERSALPLAPNTPLDLALRLPPVGTEVALPRRAVQRSEVSATILPTAGADQVGLSFTGSF